MWPHSRYERNSFARQSDHALTQTAIAELEISDRKNWPICSTNHETSTPALTEQDFGFERFIWLRRHTKSGSTAVLARIIRRAWHYIQELPWVAISAMAWGTVRALFLWLTPSKPNIFLSFYCMATFLGLGWFHRTHYIRNRNYRLNILMTNLLYWALKIPWWWNRCLNSAATR